MSAEARENGWRGFDGIGQREKGGYLYRCDGMPTQVGCGSEIVVRERGPWAFVTGGSTPVVVAAVDGNDPPTVDVACPHNPTGTSPYACACEDG